MLPGHDTGTAEIEDMLGLVIAMSQRTHRVGGRPNEAAHIKKAYYFWLATIVIPIKKWLVYTTVLFLIFVGVKVISKCWDNLEGRQQTLNSRICASCTQPQKDSRCQRDRSLKPNISE